MKIIVWTWPECDHTLWVKHCNGSGSFRESRDRLVAVIADLEQQGHYVETVEIPVKTMLDELARLGLENTPDNRARIAGGWMK